MATHMMQKSMDALEIPAVPAFLELIKASGAHIWACGLRAAMNPLTKGRMEHLKFSPVGNTATHIPAALAPFPGMTSMATHMMQKSMDALEIPAVPEFLELIKASGGHIWACRLSADMNHLTKDDLWDGVDDIINASDFIEMTDGAQLLFI
jgi:peroxiredoxin family protein